MNELASGDTYGQWKALKTTKPNTDSFPLRVDQAVGGGGDCTTMWERHYSGILDCVRDDINTN